jgi:S1-C subfamily serine protease
VLPKLALAFSAPLLLSNAPPSEPIYTDIPAVRMVVCGTVSGTAFRVGTGAFVTARHVIVAGGCTIDGEWVNVTWESAELDIAVLRTKVHGKPLEIDCGGFQDRQGYAGVGHARGLPQQRVIFVMFAADIDSALPRWMRFSTLFGARFIPGQSGGPVFGSSGKVVGVVSGFNTAAPLSYSIALKDTPLCSSK